jgi:8-oxo-dGTP pyrophosphatase MutT (NUDIX family)
VIKLNFIEQIDLYIPETNQEENEKRVISDYIKQFPESILLRENEFAHMTSSGFIMNPQLDKVLFIHHKIYNTWTWTGGHADGDTDLYEIALKEAREETGVINFKLLLDGMVTLDIIPVFGHVKKGKYICSHLHLNSTYILIAEESEKLIVNEEETSDVRWIPKNDLDKFSDEPYIIEIYNKIIKKAEKFKKNKIIG